MKVDRLVTHRGEHIDELADRWILGKCGEEKYPGVASAEIVYVDAGSEPFDGLTVEQWEERGTLAFGVWGGRFDEHPGKDGQRKEGECSFSLVVKDIGLDGSSPALDNIVKYVLRTDLKGKDDPLNLASMVNTFHLIYPDEPERVAKWAMTGLEAKFREIEIGPDAKKTQDCRISGDFSLQKIAVLLREQNPENPEMSFNWFNEALEVCYRKQTQFLGPVREEFETNARFIEMIGPRGQVKKVAVIGSDNRQIKNYGFFRGVDLVILWQPSGHFQLFTSPRSGLHLIEVAKINRSVEQFKNGKQEVVDRRELAGEKSVAGWYLGKGGRFLLNGGEKASGVPPTKLSLREIASFVRIGINPDFFLPDRAEQCRAGICTHKEEKCPWYRYGLKRCSDIRAQQHIQAVTADLKL